MTAVYPIPVHKNPDIIHMLLCMDIWIFWRGNKNRYPQWTNRVSPCPLRVTLDYKFPEEEIYTIDTKI